MIDNVKASLKTVIVGERSAGPLRPTKNLSCFQHVLLLAQNDLDGFHPCRLEEEQTYLAVSKDYRYGVWWREGKVEEFCGSHGFQWRGKQRKTRKRNGGRAQRKIVTVLIYNKKLSFKKLSDITRTESQGTELVWHSNFWHFKQLVWNYFKYRNFWRPVVSFIYHGYKVTFIKSAKWTRGTQCTK